MRIAPPIVIDETTRKELERLSRKRSMASRVVLRSRIVLLAVDGMQNKQIAERLGVSTRMAALWRGRFLVHGIEGLLKDAPGLGAHPRSRPKSSTPLLPRPPRASRPTPPTGLRAPWLA